MRTVPNATIEASGEARFPFPPHGRIPNFAGADAAAERLAGTPAWAAASTVKANPDAPQLPVRRVSLRAGKVLYVAVPRLRDERAFRRLDPAEIDDVDAATTVSGIDEYGEPVGPAGMDAVDLIVSGSVAVNDRGTRIGKGEGYSDLEFAVLRGFDLVDEATTTATTVHERQVIDATLPTAAHDVPMDLVVTPEDRRDGGDREADGRRLGRAVRGPTRRDAVARAVGGGVTIQSILNDSVGSPSGGTTK